jgi:hypothetical protein
MNSKTSCGRYVTRTAANTSMSITSLAVAENPSAVVYGADTGEESGITHRPSDAFKSDGWNMSAGFEGIHRLDDQLDDFQIGYDTGFAPIHDRSGRLVGELGIKLGWAPATMQQRLAIPAASVRARPGAGACHICRAFPWSNCSALQLARYSRGD